MGLSDWLSKDAPQKDVPMESTSFSNEMVIFLVGQREFQPSKVLLRRNSGPCNMNFP